MKIKFSKQDNQSIIRAIEKTMDGRAINDMITLSEGGGGLVVTISKLGTSSISFKREDQGDFAIFTIASEKIAFAHRAFKDEVKSKLIQVIERSGGTLIES